MRAHRETIFKWSLYAAATVLCFVIQGALLQRLTIWGVIPFIYPLTVAVAASFEDPVPAAVYSLAAGVVCDLLLPGLLPCLYTLAFPLAGLLASLIARSLLPNGFLCSLVVSALAFVWTGGISCLALAAEGHAAWAAGGWVLLRELCVTLPLAFPVTVLFRAVHRRTHLDD